MGAEGAGDRAASSSGVCVAGFREFCEAAAVPERLRPELGEDTIDLGAVRVQEVTAEDWHVLPTWQQPRPLEQRRVLQHV